MILANTYIMFWMKTFSFEKHKDFMENLRKKKVD